MLKNILMINVDSEQMLKVHFADLFITNSFPFIVFLREPNMSSLS